MNDSRCVRRTRSPQLKRPHSYSGRDRFRVSVRLIGEDNHPTPQSSRVTLDPIPDLAGRERPTDEVALERVASDRAQLFEGLLRLDSLGNHPEREVVGDVDSGTDEREG